MSHINICPCSAPGVTVDVAVSSLASRRSILAARKTSTVSEQSHDDLQLRHTMVAADPDPEVQPLPGQSTQWFDGHGPAPLLGVMPCTRITCCSLCSPHTRPILAPLLQGLARRRFVLRLCDDSTVPLVQTLPYSDTTEV